MQDGRDVVLGPVDGKGEAGNQNQDRLGIGGHDLLDKRFLGEVDGFAVAAFTSVPRIGARFGAGVGPVVGHVRAAGRVIADDDNGYIGGFCGGGGATVVVVCSVGDRDVRPHCGLDAGQRGDRIGRIATIPVPVDAVGQGADDRDRFQSGFVKRERGVVVFEQDDGFERSLQ